MLTLFLREWLTGRAALILPVQKQIKAWQKANRKIDWKIPKVEFEAVGRPPPLTETDLKDGFIGSILCYGFGDDA